MAKKELQVSAIENGTVIDHIPADKLFDVINVLGIADMENAMTFGTNLRSVKLGKKAIIKIWDKFLEDDEVNKLALVAPAAKINIIRDYDVVEKKTVNVPEKVEGIVKCMNPKCITNHEYVRTKFTVVNDFPIVLKCHYCEKLTDQEHMEVI
ncbi:aspartate carbamoyltransferase regulatory subunit [Odoribacter laneus]|uniref:Aspartate carbamoyltransferase regulatory chain n=1 Tax=Odoribacter laneus YIT 12061 TaxID=742817 RepID=H1DJQ6_9BACT|nr:aspartate carbamoyltransferase regulatory subunit [Odoribacter laneus]EHP46125.1 aspartate carbamoyltransferase, regulatory subunit [Odoribacter laneus YIT 12061]